MYHWAHGALLHSCNYLKFWFGEGSCLVKTGRLRGLFHTPEKLSLIFDPRLGGDDAKCSCNGVDRWEVCREMATRTNYLCITTSLQHLVKVCSGLTYEGGFARQQCVGQERLAAQVNLCTLDSPLERSK